MFEKIPAEMKRLRQWVCWQLKDVDDGAGGRRKTKVPLRTDGKPASTTNPNDWVTFGAAARALRHNKNLSGIGFVFTRDSGLVGVDLDKCRDPETGETEPWAKAILVELDTYTELSQSGRGWHAIVKGSLPASGNRKGRIEMYDHDRYFVMTGRRAANSTEEIQARDLTSLHARLLSGQLDPQGIVRATRRKARVTDHSPSGRDFALIGAVARELSTNDALAIEGEIRRRHPEYYAERQFQKQRQSGYWAYSIVRFLEYRRDQLFRKPARIDFPKAS